MKQKSTGNAGKACINHGFTRRELLIVIAAGIVLLLLMLLPNIESVRERSRRLECLANENSLWKATSQWGLDPIQTWRPGFPETNLASDLTMANSDFSPATFICPVAAMKNKSWGFFIATNLTDVRENNCNYVFFGWQSFENGADILIADKNGSNNIPSGTNWGGNHDGLGGNVIKVAGQGFWVDSFPIITNGSSFEHIFFGASGISGGFSIEERAMSNSGEGSIKRVD